MAVPFHRLSENILVAFIQLLALFAGAALPDRAHSMDDIFGLQLEGGRHNAGTGRTGAVLGTGIFHGTKARGGKDGIGHSTFSPQRVSGGIDDAVGLLLGYISRHDFNAAGVQTHRNHGLLLPENDPRRHRVDHIKEPIMSNHLDQIGDLAGLLVLAEEIDRRGHLVRGDQIAQNILVRDIQRMAEDIDADVPEIVFIYDI